MQSGSGVDESRRQLQRPADEEHLHGRSSDGYKKADQSRREALREHRLVRYSDRNDRLRRVRVQSSWHSRELLQL